MFAITRKRMAGLALLLATTIAVVLGLPNLAIGRPKMQPAATAIGLVCTTGPTFNLRTATGYIQTPDGNSVFMWGYTANGNPFQMPGPILCVNQGDTVTVNLVNNLPEPSSIIFPGQVGVTASGGSAGLVTNEAAPGGGSVSYSFVASEPGTYLYESGTNQQKQVHMGLYGAIVVRPSMGANFAYNDVSTQFDPSREYILIMHEFDPALHRAVERNRPFDLNTRHDRYWTINGRSMPDTLNDNFIPWMPSQPYGALVQVDAVDLDLNPNALPALIRYANAGTVNHPFHPHGDHLTVIGQDGRFLSGATIDTFARTIAAGQTNDLLFTWTNVERWQPGPNGPVPVTMPQLQDLVFKDGVTFYSGDPELGQQEDMPISVTSFNQCGEFYYPWHSHALNEVQNFDEGFGGLMTLVRRRPAAAALPIMNDQLGMILKTGDQIMYRRCIKVCGLGVLSLVLLWYTGHSAQAATVTVNLCASNGLLTLPDATTTPIWGYVTNPGVCVAGLANSLPGPQIQAAAGDTVVINLANALNEPVSIVIPGQTLIPTGGAAGPFTVVAPPGGSATYTINSAAPGTYLYESGSNFQIQVAMGLYGALVVTSASPPYTGIELETVLLLSEIDPNLNANPATFNLLNYKPTYFLINGQSHPNLAALNANPGDDVLLRYVNAGMDHYAMAVLGAHQRILARDGSLAPSSFLAVAETVPAGQTLDTLVTVPAAAAGTSLKLYNRNMYVTNNGVGPGGMRLSLNISNAPPPPPVNQAPFVNAGLDQTIALPASAALGGTVTDDGLPAPTNLLTTWSYVSGPGTVAFLPDANSLAATVGFSAAGTYVVRLTATDGALVTSDDITIVVNPAPGNRIYVSSSSGGTVGGVAFDDEDVLVYNTGSNTWSILLDLSDVGVTADVDAFAFADGGNSVLVSFDSDIGDFPGPLGGVDDSDILKFTPTSWGSLTAGPDFTMYFDGSDVGLSGNDEDIDALHLLPDGRLVISTLGSFGVPGGVSGNDEDLILFSFSGAPGATTTGSWAFHFDGSDVGLNTNDNEDIWGVWQASATSPLYLSTVGNFSVTGLSGDEDDIFICTPGTFGANTACTFTLFWNGGAAGVGYGSEQLDGISVNDGPALIGGAALDQSTAGSETEGPTEEVQDDVGDSDVAESASEEEAQRERTFLPLITR